MKKSNHLYPVIKKIISKAIPDFWPGLHDVLEDTLYQSENPEAILPVAACQAVNGDPETILPVIASVLVAANSLRILDALFDRDRRGQLWERTGISRAWNYASVMQTLCFKLIKETSLPIHRLNRLHALFIDSLFVISGGQDRDIAGAANTIHAYWETIEMKTGAAYAVACAAGATAGTDNQEWIEACHT